VGVYRTAQRGDSPNPTPRPNRKNGIEGTGRAWERKWSVEKRRELGEGIEKG